MSDSPEHGVEQTEALCEHCDEPVDINSTDIFKSVSEQFYHKDCFAEYCFERRSLVATPEGSFKIKPVVIKEIEDGKESVIESFWRAECPICYRTHETDEMAEDIRQDFVETVTDCCGTKWLPPADWIEDCEICGTSHRESRDCEPLSFRDPFPDPEEHRYECSKCGWSGEGEDFGNADGYCPECESAAVRALKVATDGGITSDELYEAAIEAWGEDAQINLLGEESAELSAEVSRFMRGRSDVADLAEEVADAEIMIEQARLILGERAIREARVKKLDRLLNRLREAGSDV